MMTEKVTPVTAEVAVILGLHQNIGGPWKLIFLFRRLKCLHVYECVTQGRQWWFSLHMTTDLRYSFHELDPNSADRNVQYPDFWIRGGGSPYPRGVLDYLINDIEGISPNAHASVLVIREPQHHLNLSGGKETLVPSRLLYGAIPDALLDAYTFWQDESKAPTGTKPEDMELATRGYKRLRGYPVETDGEYMIIVEFKMTGDWTTAAWSQNIVNDVNNIQITGFPGRTVQITRRLKSLIEEEFHQKQRIASVLETSQLLIPYVKKKKTEDKKDNIDNVYKVDTPVECDYEGNGKYWPCVVRRVNDDGSYDIEYVDTYKWAGIQRSVKVELIQKRGDSEKKQRGENLWHWEGMSDSEDDDWREDSDDEDIEKFDDTNNKLKKRIDFYQFDNILCLLNSVNNNEDECVRILQRLSSVPGVLPFTDIHKLSRVIIETKQSIESTYDLDLGGHFDDSIIITETKKSYDSEDMIFMNLLFAPRRSRLHSILKVLTRIENISHICAWTKKSNLTVQELRVGQNEFGCPAIDLIELPRLKLAFTARVDHDNILRLYSVDHVDLFISNEHKTFSNQLLNGIPHSIILSNVREEVHVLVPVIPPIRPRIYFEPFNTFIILDRKELSEGERFFLYPVHVSLSFLLTKGLNSAVYLMLLRFLHRDYEEVFRLADSIATDTKFNEDGLDIFKAFARTNDDLHPGSLIYFLFH